MQAMMLASTRIINKLVQDSQGERDARSLQQVRKSELGLARLDDSKSKEAVLKVWEETTSIEMEGYLFTMINAKTKRDGSLDE